MSGLFRTVRKLIRDYLSFGNEEIASLRRQVEQQREQLLQLKETREQRLKHEEAVILSQLRKSIQEFQAMDASLQDKEQELVKTANNLEIKMKNLLEQQMAQRAATVMNAIDINKVLTGEFDDKDMISRLASSQNDDNHSVSNNKKETEKTDESSK